MERQDVLDEGMLASLVAEIEGAIMILRNKHVDNLIVGKEGIDRFLVVREE